MDYILLLSLGVFLLGAIDFITNFRQWLTIKRMQNVLDGKIGLWEERGDFGDQIGGWLMERKAENEPTNLEVLGTTLGGSMVKSMNASYAGAVSGDVRKQKAIDSQVFEAVKQSNPDLNLAAIILEKLGLPELASAELIPYATKALQKFGVAMPTRGMIQNNGSKTNRDPFRIE